MKKIFTFLGAAFFFAASISAQDITYNWAMSGGGASADRASAITSDANGNIYTAGVFQENATFGSLTLTGAAKGSGANFDNNLFLTKMDGNKTIAWNIQSNTGALNPTAVVVASNGDVILVGNMRAIKGAPTTNANIIDSESTETVFSGLGDAAAAIRGFIARFDANGKKIWVKDVQSTSGQNDVSDVTVDSDGNVYVVGNYSSDATLPGGTQLTSASTQASYIAKLDTDGNQVWVKTTSGGIKKEDFSQITIDGSDIYVAGTFTNQTTPVEITFGGVSMTPSAYPDIIIVKLDTDGNFSYVQARKHISTTITGNTMLRDLLVKDSKVYLAGNFKGELSFNGSSIISANNLNGFTLAFEASTCADIWQKTVSSPALTETSAISVVGDKLYAYGYFYNKTGANVGPADFGNDITLTTGDTNTTGDLFLAVYELGGTVTKAEIVAQGTGSDISIAMASVDNSLYLWGSFRGNPLSLYGTEETLAAQAGTFDFFVTKYTVSNSANNIEDVIAQSGIAKAYVKDGMLYVTGEEITAVDIYGISGNIARKATYLQGITNIELSVSDLPKGIYLVRVKTLTGKSKTIKVIF